MKNVDKFMKIFKEKDMVKGWLVGNFKPTCFDSKECEVAIKRFKKNDEEPTHYHKVATEITMVISGKIKMNDNCYKKGDIILVEPGEKVKFKSIKKSVVLSIKFPSITYDKYID